MPLDKTWLSVSWFSRNTALLATRFVERIPPPNCKKIRQNVSVADIRTQVDKRGGGSRVRLPFLLRKECLTLHLYQYVQLHINKDTSLSFWRFKSSRIYTMSIGKVPDVSKDHSAFIFRVRREWPAWPWRCPSKYLFSRSTWRNIPEGLNLQQHRCENLISRVFVLVFTPAYARRLWHSKETHNLVVLCGKTLLSGFSSLPNILRQSLYPLFIRLHDLTD